MKKVLMKTPMQSLTIFSARIHTIPAYWQYLQGNMQGRVAHGEDVLSPIPWQVSLRYENHENYKHFCGGTILDSKTILTAAHCTRYDLGSLKIVAGTKFSNVSMSGQDGVQIRNTNFFNHPDYYNNIPFEICE